VGLCLALAACDRGDGEVASPVEAVEATDPAEAAPAPAWQRAFAQASSAVRAAESGTVAGLAWQRTYGAEWEEEVSALASVPDGGLVLAGETGSKSRGDGVPDAWLVRADARGNVLWDRTFGGAKKDAAHAVVALADGSFAFAGSTSSPPARGMDAWLVRLEADGSQRWAHTYGTPGTDLASALLAVPAEAAGGPGFLLAGMRTDPRSGEDMALARTDPDGRPLWETHFGGPGADWAMDVERLPDGGYIVAGRTQSGPPTGQDVLLVRTDAQGVPRWQRPHGGLDADAAFKVRALPGGGFLVAGETRSKGGGERDAWLLCTDADGRHVWDRTYGGPRDEWAWALGLSPDGGSVLGASRTQEGKERRDAWILRLDPRGEVLWDHAIDGGKLDDPVDIVMLPDGFVVAGVTTSRGAGWWDGWIARFVRR